VTVGQTGVQRAVPTAVRITNTRKAHLVAVALVDWQLNDRVVRAQVQVRRLHSTNIAHRVTVAPSPQSSHAAATDISLTDFSLTATSDTPLSTA